MDPRRERWVHLIYLAILFMQPALAPSTAFDWLLAVALAVGFAIWYIGAETLKPWVPLVLVAVGFAASFINPGASVYFVYAAFMLGSLHSGKRMWRTLAVLAAVVAVQGLVLFQLHGSPFAAMSHAISLGMIGFAGVVSSSEFERREVNRRLREANERIAAVSRMAERERIARDMHDVLGHTLSVVVLKLELAGKLLAADPERAASEIADVEQLARSALKDVRSAISGYRERGFQGEVDNARLAFEAAGIRFHDEVEPVEFSPGSEPVLALVLREAVTNVLRHSGARSCTVSLSGEAGQLVLVVADDGVGGQPVNGTGLRGMTERLEAIGGTLELESNGGMRVTARVPA